MRTHAASDTRSAMGVRMRTINAVSIVVAIILATLNLVVLQLVLSAQADQSSASNGYQACQNAVTQLEDASDYLTYEARQYVETGDRTHLDNYLDAYLIHDQRGSALQQLRNQAENEEAISALADARAKSNDLAQTELYAMHLVADAHELENIPRTLLAVEISKEDGKLSLEEKLTRALGLVTGDAYDRAKYEIRSSVQECSELLIRSMSERLDETTARLDTLLLVMRLGVILLLLVVVATIVLNTYLILRPMSIFEANIRDGQPLEPQGVRELRLLTDAYNQMYAANLDRTESLSYEAHNDALTGALNRGSFDTLLTMHKATSALVLVDIDYFKQFNDEYGHEMGDAILVEVAATLFSYFRATDFVCRIGGDEFAVIMTNADPSISKVIERKITQVAEFLRDDSNGLPPATISVGIAFGTPGCADDELFQAADGALYEVKRRGRDGFGFADQVPN